MHTFRNGKYAGKTLAAFFQLDRAETDPKTLRKRIDLLLQKANQQQLEQIHKLIQAVLEP
jgi:hypothetical protein